MTDPETVEQVARLVRNAERILVFTGAGISTGSGIPDFRGPQGVWKRKQPVYFQDFVASVEARTEHWDQKLEGYEAFRDAKPNAAHEALVAIERAGKLHLLVTQNIDGLHHAAGHDPDRVVELHGTNRAVECIRCGHVIEEIGPIFERFRETRTPPRCERETAGGGLCGGLLKTATISFGQAMPEEPMRRSLQAAEEADLVIAIGSTLSVQPAALVPKVAAEHAPYVIINRGETDQDALATVRVEDDAVSFLPRVVQAALE